MKKLVISFLILNCVLCIVPFCGAQVQSDCTAPPELISYDRDIKHLAIGRMFQIHSPDTSLVRIPQKYFDTIAKGMGGIIHAMREIPESDSVFNLYCIHANSDYDGIIVGVDTIYSWTDAWQNLQAMTGDPLMDTIMARYSLFVQRFNCAGSLGCYAVINSDDTWNLYALCDSLELVPGVRYAELDNVSGDGPDIAYNVIADDRYYDFTLKWGDCMSGCAYHYIWKFKVNSECQVSYLGKEIDFVSYWGAEYPVLVNCNIFSSVDGYAENAKLFVFPNPTDGIVDFRLSMADGRWTMNNGQRTILKIYNAQGQEVATVLDGNWPGDQVVRWDAGGLPAGVYFYQLKTNDIRLTTNSGKLVKY